MTAAASSRIMHPPFARYLLLRFRFRCGPKRIAGGAPDALLVLSFRRAAAGWPTACQCMVGELWVVQICSLDRLTRCGGAQCRHMRRTAETHHDGHGRVDCALSEHGTSKTTSGLRARALWHQYIPHYLPLQHLAHRRGQTACKGQKNSFQTK